MEVCICVCVWNRNGLREYQVWTSTSVGTESSSSSGGCEVAVLSLVHRVALFSIGILQAYAL